MSVGSAIFAVYSEPAARESYKHFPILSFPALFVVLVSAAAFMYWLFGKKR
jgi:hypothetical protein